MSIKSFGLFWRRDESDWTPGTGAKGEFRLLGRSGKILPGLCVVDFNAGLVELIKEAFAIRSQFLSGSDDSIEAMSGRLGMNKCRLTSLIRLSHLAPEILGALLAGRHPNALTPSRLLRLSKNLPRDWKEQRCFLCFAA